MDSLRDKILSSLNNSYFHDKIDQTYSIKIKVLNLDDDKERKDLLSKIQISIAEAKRKQFLIFLLKFKQTHWMTTVIKQDSNSLKTRAHFLNSHLDSSNLQPNASCDCEAWIIDFIQAMLTTPVFGRDNYKDSIDKLIKISMMNKKDDIMNAKIREKLSFHFLNHYRLTISIFFSSYEELYTYAILSISDLENTSLLKEEIEYHKLRIKTSNLIKHFLIVPIRTNAGDSISMVIFKNGPQEPIYAYATHSRRGSQNLDEDIRKKDFDCLQSILREFFHSCDLVKLSVNMEGWQINHTWTSASVTAIAEAVIIVTDCTKFIDRPQKSQMLLAYMKMEMEQCIKAIDTNLNINSKRKLQPAQEGINDEECIEAEDRTSENEMDHGLDCDNIGYLLYTKCDINDQLDDVLPAMDVDVKENSESADTNGYVDDEMRRFLSEDDANSWASSNVSIENHSDYLRRFLDLSMKYDSRFIILPIRFETTHWAILLIKNTHEEEHSENLEAYFFDPIGPDKIRFEAVKSNFKLKRVYNLSIKLSQEKNENLGTWVAVAIKVIMQKAENMANHELSEEIERKHQEAIKIAKNSETIQYAVQDGSDKECGKPGYLIKVQFDNYRVKNLHKSFCWRNIPMLAVVTGKNGCGKTAILEAILQGSKSGNFHKIDLETAILKRISSGPRELNIPLDAFVSMLSEGEHIHNKSLARPILLYRRNVSQICYLNSNSEEQNLATNSFNEQKDKNENSTMNLAKQSSDDFEQNFNNVLMDIKKCHIYGGQYQMESHDHEELYKKVVPKACNATKKLGLTDIPEIESQLKEKLEQYLREEMGQPIKTYGSWKDYVRYFLQMDNTLYDVNKHLYKNGFKFDVYIMEDGQLICQKRVPFNIPVIQVQLSSGEQLELLSLLWLFGSKNLAKANDSGIILLDEPDAHLHPSLVQEVIETIKTKLISKLGIQVIMTTHSPTTVSLAPKDCIYVMTENNMTKEIKIEKAASKRQAIQLLTAEFVHVNLPFRMVFVEARDDKKFYTMIQDKLARERLIASTYPLLFMAVGKHKKRPDSADESGSRMIEKSCRAYVENIVESCVNESDEDQSLREFIFGLVDNDNREDPKLYNIRCLKRYSIENYLYDPIHIYYYLRSKNKAEEMKSEINNHSVTEHPDLLSGFFEKGRAAQLTKVLQIIIDVVSKKLIDAVEKFIKFKNKFEECVKKLESLLTNLENKTETSEKESTIEDFETTCKLVHSEGNLLDYAKKIRERSKCKDVLKELIDLARKVIKAIDNLGSDKNNLIRKREDSEEVYELIKCKEEVSFGNGVMGTLSYPKVILKMRGHDLVTFYTAIYPSLPKFNSEMIAFLTRNQILIPEDLIQIFQSLQKPDVKLQRQYTRNVSREDTEKNNTKLMRRSKEQARQLRDLQNKNEKLTKRNEELRMQKKILNDCLSQVEQEMRSEQSEDVRTNMLRYFSTIREKMTNKEHECNDPEDLINGQDGIVNGFSAQ